jgi:hypothetical protein
MADTTFYSSLRKLFSGGSVIRVVNKDGRVKVIDTDNSQLLPKHNLRQRYATMYRSNWSNAGHQGQLFQANRLQLFRDYESMDTDPIIASALDMYSEESALQDEFGQILRINSSNEDVKQILHNLFYDILNINFNLASWIRNMCKYGDQFLKLEIRDEIGVVDVLPLSVYEVIRNEGYDPEHPNDVRFIHDITGASSPTMNPANTYENFEVAHFRMLTDSNYLPYGKAVIENIRRVWKQIKLMEDAMMVHRIVRAPERRMYKVDVGNIAPKDVEGYMQRLMEKTKKTPLIDNSTGEYNLKFNIQNLMEDFYLPVRGSDSGTTIENLPGLEFQTTEDIEYLQKKLFAGLKIPRAFLGYEEDTSGKATLAAEDMRFARSIERVQRIVVSELTKIAVIHLYANGYTDKELVNFSLELSQSSTIYEQEQIRIWQEKVRLGEDIKNSKMLSMDWIYTYVFKLSEDDIETEKKRIIEDEKFRYRLAQIENEGNDPAKSGQDVRDGQIVDPLTNHDDSDDVGGFSGEMGEVDYDDDKFKQGGRPRGNQTKYATDKHVLGRDPIGAKSLSRNEITNLLEVLKKSEIRPSSIMDESNILV